MSTVSTVAWGSWWLHTATYGAETLRVNKRNHLHCGLILIAHQRGVVVGGRKSGRQLF